MKNTERQRNWISRMRLARASAVLALATVLVSAVITPQPAQAQTLTTLYNFCSQTNCTDGGGSFEGLVQATNGNFYGTTHFYGAYNGGTVFKITPSGALTTLYIFCTQAACTDGDYPTGTLVQATNGDFYGTTASGGANVACLPGCGTVFKISPSGTLTTLYSFCSQQFCTDGSSPTGLIQAANGNLYGTTAYNGANAAGTFFTITPSGTLTTLYSFCSMRSCADGGFPQAGLVQATNGDFYGTTEEGGTSASCFGGCGTVFKITSSGTLTTLYSFCSQQSCTDGYYPEASLVQATNGNFYGTTLCGGAVAGLNCDSSTSSGGTVFKISSGGTLTTLYSFCSQSGCTDGSFPQAGLVQATDANLYGTTVFGGANNDGTIFKITPSGALTTLQSFDGFGQGLDGERPYAGLIQGTNGDFYGTTYAGGASNGGTVFSLSVGLKAFVETQPTSGKVRAAVKILGTNLTGATSVTFNGTSATFTVVSRSEITTTVPTGATTGPVEVITPRGTLKSNTEFRVTP